MSQTIQITSPGQLSDLLKSSRIVVTDFYADWCGPCKALAPIYEKLSASLSRPNQITFVKINTDTQKEIASNYAVTSIPTFIVFKQGNVVEKVGANAQKLQDVVRKQASEAEGGADGFASGSGSSDWRATEIPKGYKDVTNEVDVKGLDLMNANSEFGGVRTLFEDSKPSALAKGKAMVDKKDWVESDTDEQLMLFMPFQSTLKVHTLQITSLPPTSEDDEEVPMRPRTLKIYPNHPHIIGFEEADGIPATQTIILEANDWDSTGTATVALRFVKFQHVSSLVLFIVDADRQGDKVRIDRLRVIGDSGEKRDLGKLEKIEDH